MANLMGYGGQFGLSQLPNDRKGQPDLNQPDFTLLGKKGKMGFFGEGDKEISDPTSIYFPAHRSEKDVLSSQFGVGGFGQNMPSLPRGMPTPQQFPPRSLSSHHGNLAGHVTPTSASLTSGMQPINPSSPNRGILSVGHRGLSSPSRTSPSLIAMHQKQQQQQQQQRAIGTISGGYQDRTTPTSMNSFGISRLILAQQNNLHNLSNINHQTLSNSYNNATKTAPDWLQFNSNTRSKDQGSRFPFDHWSSESSPSLDLSDFPALANRGRQNDLSAFQLPNPMAGRPQYVGMVNKTAEPTPEFQIQNEDFPALPGSNNKQGSEQQNINSMDSPRFPGENPKQNSNNVKKGVQIHPDGKITNIPAGMVTDPFGMVGLLTFIRAAETDANLVQLALGSDLTTLGLNLNSPDRNLYGTFQSPWADGPCRPQDIDFHVPSEYLTNLHIKDKLAPIKLSRYGEDLLFYLYYTHGGEVLQLAAAAELYNRDWRYHKDERVWITRGPGMEPSVKTNSYEMGMYYYFDCHRWCKVPKEFHLDYDKLEERPHLPASFHHNVSTNQVAH
ncbi:CCR4-NOT transcription complex subunit 2-like isoform X1 [Antedon mediterranea]|uniref:CCR4-NOT transcription complex subunit 2-like isoform X1 n=1 Tax=Antedon mediterranea TaxID=105859 RepID=UPI003AF9CE56